MNQDDVFLSGEGDAWFQRNREALSHADRHDWPLALIDLLGNHAQIRSVIELGCANGWRLARLRKTLPVRLVGVDASEEAIADGAARYPELTLIQGSLAALPVSEEFDLTIINFVLHWIDRTTLARSVAEIDRVTRDGGILIVGDFLPDFPQRRLYHHRPGEGVYTYKQDYASMFQSLGTYREFARFTFNHDQTTSCVQPSPSGQRGACVALQKSLQGFYHHDIGHPAG